MTYITKAKLIRYICGENHNIAPILTNFTH